MCKTQVRLVTQLISAFVGIGCLTSLASAQWKEKVLYSFQGGTDGAAPSGDLIFDKAGDLLGVTSQGGSATCPPGWCGMVYQLSPPAQNGGVWTETVIHMFGGHAQNDGSSPSGGLIADAAGNLYGVTGYGGSGPCVLFGTPTGCGIVFELSPPAQAGGSWTETVLYNFQGGNDGDLPTAPLVFDRAGNLYGATEFGGGQGTTCDIFYGGTCGTVFELSPPETKGGQWTENVLHSFAGGNDGAMPNGGLVLHGNTIYGTTQFGGDNSGVCQGGSGFDGCGTLFALRPSQVTGAWTEQIFRRFQGYPHDGSVPNGSLVLDKQGYIYGTTAGGGAHEDGIVFQLKPPIMKGGSWTENFLHSFTGGNDGSGTLAGVQLGPNGSLLGTSTGGSTPGGLIFQMKPPIGDLGPWAFRVISTFNGSPDGYDPLVPTGRDGAIFGATFYGGTGQACQGGCGTIFEVSP